MVQTRFPSDAHLGRSTADSIYGVADKHGHLANTAVLWAFSSENLFASQYHRRCVSRWWCLYTASQGPNAALAGFSSDTATILLQSLRADHRPIGEFAVDPADSALVMRVATERQIPVQAPQVKATPPPELTPQPAVNPPLPPPPITAEAPQPSPMPAAQPLKVEQPQNRVATLSPPCRSTWRQA